MKRILTDSEITRLAQEYAEQKRWHLVRECIRQTYGEQAQQVLFLLVSAYNDEYSYADIGEDIVVSDQSEKPLMPDLSLPYWQACTHLWKDYGDGKENEIEKASWEMKDILQKVLKDTFSFSLDQSNDIITDRFEDITYRYDLNHPPTLSFPEVYVDETTATVE